MRVGEMNWMQVESYLRSDDRCVVPLGSTEQHAQLSLSVDSILSERVATEAAEPLGVPVFPVLAYGITPYFQDYPGTISLRMETYLHLVRDILDGLYRSGFRRILLCNGHGGNSPAGAFAIEWMAGSSGHARAVSQLVECAEDLRACPADRSRRVACLLDGEFPLDASGQYPRAGDAETDGRSRKAAAEGPGGRARHAG